MGEVDGRLGIVNVPVSGAREALAGGGRDAGIERRAGGGSAAVGGTAADGRFAGIRGSVYSSRGW